MNMDAHFPRIEMLALRASGVTLSRIADIYQIDRSTVRYHLRKYHIVPLYVETWHPKGVHQPEKKMNFWGDINPGKSYKELLRESKQRATRIV